MPTTWGIWPSCRLWQKKITQLLECCTSACRRSSTMAEIWKTRWWFNMENPMGNPPLVFSCDFSLVKSMSFRRFFTLHGDLRAWTAQWMSPQWQQCNRRCTAWKHRVLVHTPRLLVQWHRAMKWYFFSKHHGSQCFLELGWAEIDESFYIHQFHNSN